MYWEMSFEGGWFIEYFERLSFSSDDSFFSFFIIWKIVDYWNTSVRIILSGEGECIGRNEGGWFIEYFDWLSFSFDDSFFSLFLLFVFEI